MKKGYINKISDNFSLFTLSVILFSGGILILSLKIPFWSLFLGIASIQVGIVLIILTFELFSKGKSKAITENYKTVACLVCKTTTYVPKYKFTNICDNCMIQIAKKSRAFMGIAFLVFSMATFLVYAKQSQDVRKRAKENTFYCDEGTWKPEICQCGYESEIKCAKGEYPRVCSDKKFYCCTKTNNDSWVCELNK